MLELLLNVGQGAVNDNSDLPFPAGTPFKGVVKAANFITGDQLASAIGLTDGTGFNSNAGWLHFIEDSGFEIYIAKKPIRFGLTWQSINAAQAGKTLTIAGREFTCEFISGTLVNPSPISNDQAGSEWNRYIYNVFKGDGYASLSGRLDWGSYTNSMLGIQTKAEGDSVIGSGQWVKESASGVTDGYVTRGRNGTTKDDYPIRAVWYGRPLDISGQYGPAYGWRPMLVLKGSRPPSTAIFRGEVAQADFITFANLVSKIQTDKGVTLIGTAKSASDVWFKFVWNGKTLYMPRKPIRHSISDVQLKNLGLFTGTYTMVINGQTFKVRCPTGTLSDSSSEWNNLIYRMYSGSEAAANKATWAGYTADQLDQNQGTNLGNLCVCQGTSPNGGSSTLTRGGYQSGGIIGQWYMVGDGSTNTGYGWRPILELVE